MDIMTGLAAANTALQTVKAIQEIDKGINEAEYKLKIAELYGVLADVKIALSDAQTEQRKLQDEIEALRSAGDFEGKLIEIKGFKYDADEDGNPVGAPYCPVCIANDRKYFKTFREGRNRKCPNCQKQSGQASTYLYPEERTVTG